MSDTIAPTTTTTTVDDAPTRRLVRVHEGRWVGGVAAGLGRYFDVNPLVYRIAFAALAFAGGTGILLYLAAVLVIPAEDREESIAVEALRRRRDQPWLLVGVGLLSFGALLALSEARFWPDPGNVWLAAILAGAAIVWWHVSGRTRKPGTVSAGVATSSAWCTAAARSFPTSASAAAVSSSTSRRRLVPLHPLCDGVRVLEVGRSASPTRSARTCAARGSRSPSSLRPRSTRHSSTTRRTTRGGS
jgi:phage shock protein PspC (stress-responsive transcriptional regulator)